MPSINIFFPIFALLFLRRPTSSSAFTLKLVHRDFPESPLYQPNLTAAERFLKHAEISLSRASLFENNVHSSIRLPAKLDPIFTADLYIGTPAVKRTLAFDTGSGVTWTQCKPCTRCFKQNDPVFEPKKSSTYKPISKKTPPRQKLRLLSLRKRLQLLHQLPQRPVLKRSGRHRNIHVRH